MQLDEWRENKTARKLFVKQSVRPERVSSIHPSILSMFTSSLFLSTSWLSEWLRSTGGVCCASVHAACRCRCVHSSAVAVASAVYSVYRTGKLGRRRCNWCMWRSADQREWFRCVSQVRSVPGSSSVHDCARSLIFALRVSLPSFAMHARTRHLVEFFHTWSKSTATYIVLVLLI